MEELRILDCDRRGPSRADFLG